VPLYKVDLVDVLLVFIAAVGSIIFCVGVGTIAMLIVRSPRPLDARELATNALFVIPMQVVAYLMVIGFMAFIVWVRHERTLMDAISWNPPPTRLALAALGAGAILGLCSELSSGLLQRWTPKSLPIDEYFRNPSAAYLLAAFGVLIAPLVEELFFRGFLFPAVARWTGTVSAILITAAAFAALHGTQLAYAWAPLLVLFGIGIVLTVVRVKTCSVATCVIVHMGYNLTLFIMLFFGTDHFRHLERAELDSPTKKLLRYELNGQQRTRTASQPAGGKLLPPG
jgi:membrane protease YdiL (CAAX protease family)